MIARQVLKSLEKGKELWKHTSTVLVRCVQQCGAAVLKCTKPTVAHLWIFITVQQLRVYISHTHTHRSTHRFPQTCPQWTHRDSSLCPHRFRSPRDRESCHVATSSFGFNPAHTGTHSAGLAVVENAMLPWWQGVMSQCLLEKRGSGNVYSQRRLCAPLWMPLLQEKKMKMQIAWYFLVLQLLGKKLQLSAFCTLEE